MRGAYVAIVLSAAVVSAGQERPASSARGLVVQAVETGSAAHGAGLREGDVLVGWTRVDAGSKGAASLGGQFHTPFDASDFAIEQLPRGGTSVAFTRNSVTNSAPLSIGFWGITVRPVLSDADDAIYKAGRGISKERPADALTAWRPLIDRLVNAGDSGNAAWFLTEAGAALAALDQIEQADGVFEEAAGLCQRSPQPGCEAAVWDAKGRAYHPEDSPTGSSQLTTPRLLTAEAAHARAMTLRQQSGTTLATAESQLLAGFVITWSVHSRKIPDGTASEKEAFKRSGDRLLDALGTIEREAPLSFAHARALTRAAAYFYASQVPRPTNAQTPEQVATLRALRKPYVLKARTILERLAPNHDLMRTALEHLHNITLARTDPGGLAETEAVVRELLRFGIQKGDRSLVERHTTGLASLLNRRGDLTGAVALVDRQAQAGSSSAWMAAAKVDIAIEAYQRGAVDEAIALLEQQSRIANLPVAAEFRVAYNLANYYGDRGNVSLAERTALPLLSRLNDGVLTPAQRRDLYFLLANMAGARGDAQAAESYVTRALSEAEHTPTTSGLKQTFLEILANFADARGDKASAAQFIRQAISVGETDRVPSEWNQLLLKLNLAKLNGDKTAVLALTDQKLALARKQQPGGQKEADSLYDAGVVRMMQDQDAAALPFLREALPMIRELEPRSASLVRALSLLGLAEGTMSGWQAGMRHLDEAMDLLDDRRVRSGEQGAGTLMLANGSETYVFAVDLLTKGEQYERAFNVIERSRARALLDLLAARDVQVDGAAPPALLEQRRQIEVLSDSKRAELASLTIADREAVASAHLELHALDLKLSHVNRQIVEADPKAAARLRPAPLTLAEARARLDPGTVMLSYVMTWEGGYLFVVKPATAGAANEKGLTVHKLPVSAAELTTSVEAFGKWIAWDADPKTKDRNSLLAKGRQLYDWLIRPAEDDIRSASRVLLNLDGPLLSLEFGALVRNRSGAPEYFAAWKPTHRTPSTAVYARLLESRRSDTGSRTLVAFAAPEYGAAESLIVEAELDSVVRSGTKLSPLPGSKREATEIAKLFAPEAVTYFGPAATEPRAKAIGRDTRYLHFAVHGILNPQRPLDSGLALTTPGNPTPGEGNGFLQAWEIFEHMRLDADLVTLSACNTGLGRTVAGEGLVGLTSAFLSAGARSVVASHRKVADGPTAELMTRFYKHLKNGEPKDEALRKAQIEVMHMGRRGAIDFSSPAHWAAFSLTGDWK